MKRQSTLKRRLLGSLSSILAAGVLLAGYSLWNTDRLSEALTTAVTSTAVKLDLINALRQRVQEMAASQRGAWIQSSVGEGKGADTLVAKYQKAAARTHEQVAEMRPLISIEDNRRQLARIEEAIADWERQAPRVFELAKTQQGAAALKLMNEQTDGALKKIEASAAALIASEREQLRKDKEAASASWRMSLAANGGLTALLLIAGLMGVWAVLGVCRKVGEFVTTLQENAAGLASASEQLSSSSQSLASSSAQQASSIEETSASSEEVRSMAERNLENTDEASGDMEQASGLVRSSGQSLTHLAEWVNAVRDSSGKISRIIRVIDEIAFQTNILALNAAVEAARAGEAGLGFAVVAEEVRNLAQRCAKAANETTGLIEETVSRAGEGTLRLEEMSLALVELGPATELTQQHLEKVREASREQSKGIGQIGSAMSRLANLTQQVAAGAEECAAASEELAGQAASMRAVVDDLHTLAA